MAPPTESPKSLQSHLHLECFHLSSAVVRMGFVEIGVAPRTPGNSPYAGRQLSPGQLVSSGGGRLPLGRRTARGKGARSVGGGG